MLRENQGNEGDSPEVNLFMNLKTSTTTINLYPKHSLTLKVQINASSTVFLG